MISHYGAEIKSVFKKGKKITISFSNAKKLKTRDNQQFTGFEVMNEKGEIFSPKAKLKDNQVILFLITKKKLLRCCNAFKPFTRTNLENEAGLPASTFSIEIKK